MLKGQSLKFKASVRNFPISETGRNCNSLFKLVDNSSVIIMEQERKRVQLGMYFSSPDSLFEKKFC